jgi:hypothetical protein
MFVNPRTAAAILLTAAAASVSAQQPQQSPPAAPAATKSSELAIPRPGVDVLRDLLQAEILVLEKKARDALDEAQRAAKPAPAAATATLSEPIVIEPLPRLVAIDGPADALVARFDVGGRSVSASAAHPQLAASSWRIETIRPGRAVLTRPTPAKGKKEPAGEERVELALTLPMSSASSSVSPTRPTPLPSGGAPLLFSAPPTPANGSPMPAPASPR